MASILGKFGFEIVSQRGSHMKLRRTASSGARETLTVPDHPELDTGTCRAILRQASRFVPASQLEKFFWSE